MTHKVDFKGGEALTIDVRPDVVIITHWSKSDSSGAESEIAKKVIDDPDMVMTLQAIHNATTVQDLETVQ